MNTQILLILLLLSATLFAEDLTTVSGKKYTGVTINRVEADGLAISHADGLAKVPFSDLSEDIRKKYGYDPQKAAQQQAVMQAAAAQRAAEANTAAIAKQQLEANPPVRILGTVTQARKDGLIVDDYIDPEFIRNGGMRGVYSDPKRPKTPGEGVSITRGARMYFLTGHPNQDQIVDRNSIDVDAVPDGTYSYGGGKVKKFKIIRVYKDPFK
jgi:hypothetical protein